MQNTPLIEKLKKLPKKPGVYIFKDKDDDIIYVGKANILKSRVSSYFRENGQSIKTKHLVQKIKNIDFIIVDNEVEALLLENSLIKKHKPKYNILLKDSKTYAYIKITDEKIPRIMTTRRITKKGTYFGPYTDGSARKQIVKIANDTYQLRQKKNVCKSPCMYYHLGLCRGVCVGYESVDEYNKRLEKAKKFLQGDVKEVREMLTQDMKRLSAEQNFELAMKKKEQLNALDTILQRQKIDTRKESDADIIAMLKQSDKARITLLQTRKGVMTSKKEFSFEYEDDALLNFVKQYYSTRQAPKEIMLNEQVWVSEEEKKNLEEYIARVSGKKANITVPKIGNKRKMVELAEKNIVRGQEILLEMQKKLDLIAVPKIIECFDISNLGKEALVAGMVRFVDGIPDKSGYRRFAIRTVVGKNDDFACMYEAVYRRYSRLKEERENMPDLVIIDGGRGQLNAARQAMQKTLVDFDIVSLAKRKEEIYTPNRDSPYVYPKNSEMMIFIRGIRDRVHRFALTYNKNKRDRAEEK